MIRTAIAMLAVCAVVPARADDKPGEKTFGPKQLFKNLDADGDGRIAKEEWKGKRTLFTELDANKDNYLVPAEIDKKAFAKIVAVAEMNYLLPLAKRAAQVDVTLHDVDKNGLIAPGEYVSWVFAVADQDGDGAIDLDEAEPLAHWGAFNKQFGGSPETVLKRLDKDKDGKVRREEFRPSNDAFAEHDKNGDGQLQPEELDYVELKGLAVYANMSVDTLLEKFDRNKDGKLEPGEIPGGNASAVGRADKDGDGAVSRDELDRALKYAQEAQFASIDPSFIARFDLNDDEKVSRKEYPGDDADFRRLDRNRDGYVSKSDSL